jgi:hypothetical protein
MKVKNINGTSTRACSCGSWLQHWRNFSKTPLPRFCAEIACPGPPELGAHVQRADSADQNWYIVPLCHLHNAKTSESIEISERTVLVPANVSLTCGK